MEDGDRDGFPNVLAEAMAMGVPVVSTRISGIPEMIDDGVHGLLVEPRDPDALADALRRVLERRRTARPAGARRARGASASASIRAAPRWRCATCSSRQLTVAPQPLPAQEARA